ncbi:class I SAM-dependent methyltransferase [Helicobacter marmotae]|uniref:Class I SAM-dependent methyltransferase n=1 Tax=Helicobacter marmotae TaxID=152490 RepID=A0A3D8I1V8_9HELI|nr:class I SAM-dependent methyltransferase [Helicobacter marmotae]RDU59123.1 class I SAM-dependent methyltransferase [Helicobacter marmotae]
MQEDAHKWNKRYEDGFMPTEPSPFVLQACAYIKESFPALSLPHWLTQEPLVALDIACGNGRNAKLLAQIGFEVDGVDISSIALKHLENLAHINPILADLDNFNLARNRYSVVLNSFFLDRRLFAPILACLKPNALILFETFIDIYSHTPKNDKALYNGELEHIFSPQNGFSILHNETYENASIERKATYPHIVRFIAHYTQKALNK